MTRTVLAVRLLLTSLLLPAIVTAQTPSFPADEAWITVTKSSNATCTTLFDSPLDSATGTGTGSRDNVNVGEAAAQIFADDSFLYFRSRVIRAFVPSRSALTFSGADERARRLTCARALGLASG